MSSGYQAHMLYHQLRNGCTPPLPFELDFSQAPARYDDDYEVLDSAQSGLRVLSSPSTAITPVSVNESAFSSEVSFRSPWKSMLPQTENRSPQASDDEQLESQEEFESYMAAIMCEYGAPADVVSDFSLTRPIIPSPESDIHCANIDQVIELEEAKSANTVGTIGTLGMASPSLGILTPPLTSGKIDSAGVGRQHKIAAAVVNADDEQAVREHSGNPYARFVSNITVGMSLQPDFTSRNDASTASSSSVPQSSTGHVNTAEVTQEDMENKTPRTIATSTQALCFSEKKGFIPQEQRQRAGIPSDVFWTTNMSDRMQGQGAFRRDDADTADYTFNSTAAPANQSRDSYNAQHQQAGSPNNVQTGKCSECAKDKSMNKGKEKENVSKGKEKEDMNEGKENENTSKGKEKEKPLEDHDAFIQGIDERLKKKRPDDSSAVGETPVNAQELARRLSQVKMSQVKKERMDAEEESEEHPYYAQPNPQYAQYNNLKIENSQDISSNSNDAQWTRRDEMKDMLKRTGKRLKGKFQRKNSEGN